MVKYTSAALVILTASQPGAAATTSSAFINPLRKNPKASIINSRRYSAIPYDSRRYSAIPYDEFSENFDEQGVVLPSFPSTANLLDIPEDNQAEVDALLAKKEKRRVARLQRARTPNYQITLPLSGSSAQPPPPSTYEDSGGGDANQVEALALLVAKGQEIALSNTIGMSLRQVYSGRKLSELALDVDTMRFQSFEDEVQGRRVDGEENSNVSGSVQVLQNSSLEMLEESFDGVVVSSVARGGLAWQSGVRAGDVLIATSATIGSKLWPKSTLDGVRSAISSRKVILPTMDFEFRRLASEEKDGAVAMQSFELSLSRPIGINVEETDDGYVTIMGISDKAAPVVKNNLRVGDRVVSVESSVGAQMWDVYSVDGLTSAVTSRLPGQPVRILFQRISEVDETTLTAKQPPSAPAASFISNAIVGFRQAGQLAAVSTLPSSSTATQMQRKMLLSRSRDLLRTYIARNEVIKNIKVADRVLEAIMDASAILDGKTLNLIMKAYNTCRDAAKAITIFEEVFGLAGDGSEKEVERIYGGKLSADMTALNIFNISALLQAHAIRGDYESALRVLAAVEGKTEFYIKGRKSRSWSGLGDPLNMLPDTRMYNIALSAAAKRGTKEGLLAAAEVFKNMPNPLNNPPLGKPAKNLVTYNVMIDAFAMAGQYQNALEVFQSLKKSSLKPDRVSFTALIKASIKSGDLEKALDLLDDMKWIGIQPDLVTYNNIIESLCDANRLFEAKNLVNEMENARVSPDSMTYGLLMNGLLKANKPGPCLTLFESACTDDRTAAFTENVQLYTTAISAAAALGDHERALDLVSRMNLAGVKPNEKTFTALMGACIAGGNYGTAAKIFLTIRNPDSYAISVGLRAMCLAGKFDEALKLITDHRNGQKGLTGKQVVSGYNNLIQEALCAREFNVAREALSGLLQAGYIPSKLIFKAIIEALNLQSDMPLTSAVTRNIVDLELSDRIFAFLLFVLDSLERRKLAVDSAFYSSILVSAAQTGGLQKRIASLLTRSRKMENQTVLNLSEIQSSDELASSLVEWEELFLNYSSYKEELRKSRPLPSIRVTTKDFGRVLAAEQAVEYRGGRVRLSR